jgi:hypothetical protein
MKELLYLLSILFTITSCQHYAEYEGIYPVNYGGCIGKKELKVNKVGENLYQDNNNNLYFLTFDNSKETDSIGEPVFIQRIYNECANYIDVDKVIDFSSYDLKNYIDLESFQSLGGGNYQDNKSVYFHSNNVSGGDLFRRGARAYSFLGNGFYRGSDGLMYIQTHYQIKPPSEESKLIYREVPEIDIQSFSCEDIDGYCMDNKNVYYKYFTTEGSFIKTIDGADLASFEIIEARFISKDKNYVYERASIVPGLDPSLINSKEDFLQFKKSNLK